MMLGLKQDTNSVLLLERMLRHVICSTPLKMTPTALRCRHTKPLCVSPGRQKMCLLRLDATPWAVTKH